MITILVLQACSYGLQKQPTVNAVIDGQEIIYRDFVDISVAVATPKVLKNIIEFVFFFNFT